MGDLIDLNSVISANRIDPAMTTDAEGDAKYRQITASQTFTPTVRATATSLGTIATDSANPFDRSGLEVKSADSISAAYMSFHRPGVQAFHFGIDTNNQFVIGGWSLGAASYRIFHEGSPPQIKAPFPTATVAGNSFVLSWNSVQFGQGVAELCNYSGNGGGDAFNFFRLPGNPNSVPTLSNRVARIDVNGAYVQTSDRRVKSNFSDAPGLSVILSLLPQRYQHWECLGFDEKTKSLKLGKIFKNKIGFVAQDVQKHLPEVVSIPESELELYGIDISQLVPVLVRAVQELESQIQELRTQVAAIPKK